MISEIDNMAGATVAPAPQYQLSLGSGTNRPFNFGSVPYGGEMLVTSIDLDLTQRCNLRCSYCFKEKVQKDSTVKTCKDAIMWLIHASGAAKAIHVAMIGGEPLMQFKAMKEFIPYAKRRAGYHGKEITFGMTTNGTIMTDDIQSFCRKWSVGFHSSIDGTPEIQDTHRVFQNGKGSSSLLEKNVPKMLDVHRVTMARSTVMPDTAHNIYDNYKYFRSLGYIRVGQVPAAPSEWSDETISIFEEQFDRVGDDIIEKFRAGTFVDVKEFTAWMQAMGKKAESGGEEGASEKGCDGCDDGGCGTEKRETRAACGVGRGMMLIDVDGGIWPCHRWNSGANTRWKFGSIYEEGFNKEYRSKFFDMDKKKETETSKMLCDTCISNTICNGGCPAENLEETGNPHHRHWNACELTRASARAAKRVHDILFEEQNELLLSKYYSVA